MKLTTSKDVLQKGIQGVQGVINVKNNLPILSNILIEAANDNVSFTATDLSVGVVSIAPIKPSIIGTITIPAKKFSDIIKELMENEEISILVKKNNLVHIESGKSLFKIMGLPKDEFPQLPEFKDKNSITLAQKRLKKMLNMTSFAISHDEARYVLNGILFVIRTNYIRLVATDGRRLAAIEDKIELSKTAERNLIVPTKAINELERILNDDGDVLVSLGENQVCFDMGQTRVISRLIEGDFPNYEQVIPKEAKEKLVVEREKLLSAVKKVALFTNPDSMAVKMTLSRDKMVLSKSTPYIGEARVELDVDYKAKDLSIGFNPDYLMDVLKNIDQETVGLELVDSEKPAAIRIGDEYVYVVLPMQLS